MKSDHLLNNNNKKIIIFHCVFKRPHTSDPKPLKKQQQQKNKSLQPKLNICVLVRKLKSLQMKS